MSIVRWAPIPPPHCLFTAVLRFQQLPGHSSTLQPKCDPSATCALLPALPRVGSSPNGARVTAHGRTSVVLVATSQIGMAFERHRSGRTCWGPQGSRACRTSAASFSLLGLGALVVLPNRRCLPFLCAKADWEENATFPPQAVDDILRLIRQLVGEDVRGPSPKVE